MHSNLKVLSTFSLLAAVTPSLGQESAPISTERPGFSSSPQTLGISQWQVEGGYQFTTDNNQPDSEDHTLPFAVVRYGLTDRTEIQFSWAGHSWLDVAGQRFDGTNDAGLGVKWSVSDENATVPLALFAGLSVPLDDSDFGTGKVEPTVGAFWSYSGSVEWFGTALVSESGDETSVDNAVGISFALNRNRGGYVEYFGNYGSREGPLHNLNGGVTFLYKSNFQLDINAGFGLNDRAADFFLGFGAAYRF